MKIRLEMQPMRKSIKYFLMGLSGLTIGVLSPWPITDWHWWAIVAPASFFIGALGMHLIPERDK